MWESGSKWARHGWDGKEAAVSAAGGSLLLPIFLSPLGSCHRQVGSAGFLSASAVVGHREEG